MSDFNFQDNINAGKFGVALGILTGVVAIARVVSPVWSLFKKLPIVNTICKISDIQKKVDDLEVSVRSNNEKLEHLSKEQEKGFDRLHDTLNALIAGNQPRVPR